jgi:hypothetical protein
MPGQDERASHMKHTWKAVEPTFPTDRKAAIVLKSSRQPLDLYRAEVAAGPILLPAFVVLPRLALHSSGAD